MMAYIGKWFERLLSPQIMYMIGGYSKLNIEPTGKYIWLKWTMIKLLSILQLSHEKDRLPKGFCSFTTFGEFSLFPIWTFLFWIISYTTFICFVKLVFHRVEILNNDQLLSLGKSLIIMLHKTYILVTSLGVYIFANVMSHLSLQKKWFNERIGHENASFGNQLEFNFFATNVFIPIPKLRPSMEY